MSKIIATLPNGTNWEATMIAHKTVWQLYRGVVNTAYSAAVELQGDDGVMIRSVYADQWETSCFVIYPDGEVSNLSEQSAPSIPSIPDEMLPDYVRG